MAGSLDIYPPAEFATRRVHLADHGQDFLWLDVDASGVIVGAGPFQGWLWRGKRTDNKFKSRTCVSYLRGGDGWVTIRYPITRVQMITKKAA